MVYEVQTQTICQGWINCWTDNENPTTFATREQAQSELDAFLSTVLEAVVNGYMEDDTNRDDYRIVPVA